MIVIINPDKGGNNFGSISGNLIEKNYNLELSKIIYNRLKELGINAYLTRNNDSTLSNQERITFANNLINNNDKVIFLTNKVNSGNDSGIEIIYALRNDDTLARDISNNIENIGGNVIKYYQLRDPNNTSTDFYEVIKEPNKSENIIINYGYIDNSFDNNFLLNNIEKLGKSVADGIYNYLKKANIYTVKQGDSLFSIATKLQTSVDALKIANNLTTNNLVVGQELIIPSNNNDNLSGNDESMDMYVDYIVKQGDSLYKIANLFNTTVNIVKDVNNLENNVLKIGQILKIPTITQSDNTNYNNYTVKSGDSLYKIANTFNTSVDAIKDLNNLTSNLLNINQVLKIPNEKGNENQEDNYSLYTVKQGDSLYKIASIFNTSVDSIKDLNNLTSNLLNINQVLKIPSNNINLSNNFINYTVKSGDSLYKIANNFNTSVDAIKNLNNLTSNLLNINQVLKIPNN